jgi:hypothetical protein
MRKKNKKIPEFLKDYDWCSEVFYSLPVVQKDEKVNKRIYSTIYFSLFLLLYKVNKVMVPIFLALACASLPVL